jgi:ParB family chromosome partitioning protein
VSSALFPLENYDGSIVSDLFGDERYFDDAEKFWKLQAEAVIRKQAAYLEAGWRDVVVMNIGEHFYGYDKIRRGKDEGGKVYIACARDGTVECHEGWLDEKEARRLDKAAAKASGEGKADAPAKPELTKAAIRYLELHRHNAVRVELLKVPQIALRLIAASAVSTGGLWDVRPETQSTNGNKPVARSVAESKAQKAIDAEREAVRELLGLPRKGGFRFLIRPSWEPLEACALFARLLELPDNDVLRILAFLMAETLEAGTPEVEALGHILKVDMGKWWTSEDTFFDLLRDKPAINAMAAELAGNRTAAEYVTATAKVQKDVIKACLAGSNGRKKVTGWTPRYMRFPMQSYTKRKGLPAIEQWSAVRKLFDRKA